MKLGDCLGVLCESMSWRSRDRAHKCRCLTTISVLILLAILAGCAGGGSTPLTVEPPPTQGTPDFSLSILSPYLNIQQGQGNSLNVTLTALNGFAGTVTLTAESVPNDVDVFPLSVQASVSGNAAILQTIGFTASTDAAVGSTMITIVATSGTLNHSSEFSLVVQSPSSITTSTNGSPPGRTRYVRADTVTENAQWLNTNWIVYDSSTGQFLMTDPMGGQVVVFNASTETKVASIAVPGAFGIDITPDQSTVYVGTLIGDIYAINTATDTITKRYVASQIGPSGFQAVTALVMADGRLALLGAAPYLSSFSAIDGFGGVAFWDPSTNSLSNYDDLNDCGIGIVEGFARSPDRTKLFLGTGGGSGTICQVTESSGQAIAASMQGASSTWKVNISPDGNYIALPGYPGETANKTVFGQVLLFNAQTLGLVAEFPVAALVSNDTAFVFSADSKTLFVPDENGLIYAYSVATQQLTGWLPNLDVQSTGGCSPCTGPGSYPSLEATDGTGLFAGPMEEGIGFMDLSLPHTGPLGSIFPNDYLNPNTGPTAGGTQVEWNLIIPVTSVNANSSIYFGGQKASNVYDTDTGVGINATTPPGNPGPADIYLFANDGGVQMLPEAFSYGPTVLEVTTDSSAPQGGGMGYIYGYGFGPFSASGLPIPADLQVSIGGAPATILAYVSDGYGTPGPPLPLEAISFTIPPGPSGSVDVSVTTTAGTATASGALTYRGSIQRFALPGSVLIQGIYDSYTGLYYFTDANEIQVFSKTLGQWLSPIPIPFPPGATSQRLWGLGLSPDGTKLVVADEAASAIYLLSPASRALVQTFSLNALTPPGSIAINPCAVAVSDSGIVYIGGVGGLYKLDITSGTLTSYDYVSGAGYSNGVSKDQNLRATITKDNSQVFFGAEGSPFVIETATDQIVRPNVYIGNASGYEMALSNDQAKLFGGDIIYDVNFNAQSFLTLNDRESPQANTVYGSKWSVDGALLYVPLVSGIDVFDGNLGTFRNQMSLPFALSENYDALVSDDTDNVLVAITGQNGNGGIALIDLSSLPEPAPLPYQSDLRRVTARDPVSSAAANSATDHQSGSTIPSPISQRIRHVTRGARVLQYIVRGPAIQ